MKAFDDTAILMTQPNSANAGAAANTDPAVIAGDIAFIRFIATCEQSVEQQQQAIAVRDAIAEHAAALSREWRMTDPAFRQLQHGAPYSSYQLYLNETKSLSVILDIFAPGQVAPVHNHRCWGVFACLEGAELERRYAVPPDLSGSPYQTTVVRNNPGDVSVAAPERNAFHQVECVGDLPAISLHIYGADLKALERDRWDEHTGRYVAFRSASRQKRNQAGHYLTPQGLRQWIANT